MKAINVICYSKMFICKIIFLMLFVLTACSSNDKHLQEIASLNAKNRDLERLATEKQNEIAAEKKMADSLAAEKKALEAKKDFNDKFEKIRREFSRKEADVYRQGNSLIIRLKGLKFPSSQAILKGNNFALLAKVQKAIKEFGQSSVLVSGHADASGGKAINTKVSRNRAQTVREYLISNGVVPRDRIKAIGYKDDMPLATNKTLNGKAQNRRVDVVITL